MGYGSNLVPGIFSKYGGVLNKNTDVAGALLARDYKGFGNQETNGVIECKKTKCPKIQE